MNKYYLSSLALAVLITCNLSGCLAVGAVAVGETAAVATDRRSTGTYIDDKSLEINTSSQINKNVLHSHINVNAYNHSILLSGETTEPLARDKANSIAQSQRDVRNVFNYIDIAAPSSFQIRSNDIWITTKVHSNLMSTKNLPSNQIKVTTERGVVYLMGMLTDEESKLAARIASQTAGVQQVITLFEPYIAP